MEQLSTPKTGAIWEPIVAPGNPGAVTGVVTPRGGPPERFVGVTRMKPCRWCGQPIEPSAQKCHHCQTWQRDDADREAQVLDKGTIQWGKLFLGFGAFLAAVVAAAGGFDLYHAHQHAWEAEMAARTSQVNAEASAKSAKNEAERSSLDARKLLDEAKAKVADLQKEVEKQLKSIGAQIEDVTGRARSLDEQSQNGDNLKNLGQAINVLQRQVTALQEKLAAGGGTGQAAQTPLSPNEVAELDQILRIEQTASEIAGSDATGTRQSYDVAFSLCSFIDGACGANRLSEVSRVVYRFDPKWFSVADVPVASAANRFSYKIRVWGVTRVRACIFIRGMPDRPIVRVGTISLANDPAHPAYWGPDPSPSVNECSNLNSR